MNQAVFKRVSLSFAGRYWPGATAVLAALVLGLLLIVLPLETAVLLLVGTAVFLLTIIQPLFGLALTLIVGPIGALEQLFSGSSSLDSGQILLFFTFAAWAARGLARRKLIVPQTFITLPILLLIGVSFLSLIGARSVELGIREILKWVEILLIVFLVVDLCGVENNGAERHEPSSIIGGPLRTLWIVGMLLLAGVSQAVIGIWQFGLRGDGPEHFIVLDRFYRAYGTFEQPNPFGGFMNLSALLAIGVLVGLVAVWWRVVSGEGRVGKKRVSSVEWQVASGEGRVGDEQGARGELEGGGEWVGSWKGVVVTGLVLAAAGITSLALLFSWSRGAWLGFAAGLGVMILFGPRKRIYGLALIGIGLFIIALAFGSGRMPSSVTERITGFRDDFSLGDVRGVDINDDNYSILERQAHWQAGLDMLRDNIYLGVGFGNYAAAYPDYALINWPDPLGHAHNYYINLLAEIVVLGLIAYLLFWGLVLWQSVRLLGVLDWPGRGIILGLLGVWIALTVHHLVDKLYVNNIYIHLGVLLGLLQLMSLPKREKGLELHEGTQSRLI